MKTEKYINLDFEVDEKIVKVNSKDEVIGFMPRKERRFLKNFYRVVSIFVFNDKNELLICQRSSTKSTHPDKWSHSVAGIVTSDELDYEIAATRETKEELGLIDFELVKGQYVPALDGRNYFVQFYFCRKNVAIEDLNLQEEEVQAARWISIADLKKELQENPDKFISKMDLWTEFLEKYEDYI